MVKAIEMNVYGLKCDTSGCGYRDETVPLADYEAWVDRPCPKCGGNLLTRGDFEITMGILLAADLYSEIVGDIEVTPERLDARKHIAVELNGTGDVAFRIKPAGGA